MEKQVSFMDLEYRSMSRKTRKEVFLDKMSEAVPLGMFCEIVEPFYPKKGNGREPTPLDVIMKMYLVSHWYNLSDEATEDLLSDSLAVRNYVGVNDSAPDATTLLRFRHLLEKNGLTRKIFEKLTESLVIQKIICKAGTIVDATIIEAPDTKKNKELNEMASTKKGNKHYYGLKAHIGVDRDSGLTHGFSATPANVSDVEAANNVLHGKEETVHGDAGYIGIDKREEICEKYQDGTKRKEKQKPSHGKKRADTFVKRTDIEFIINKKRKSVITDEDKAAEKEKSRVRAKVEHTFSMVKQTFGFRKTRYRTLYKTECKMLMLFALANIYRCVQRRLYTK